MPRPSDAVGLTCEELGCDLGEVRLYHTVEYEYPDFHLSMDCFVCTLAAHKSPLLSLTSGMIWSEPLERGLA